MKKFLQKRMKNEKGLTLVELLAVIVILGIIAAIAVPSIGNIIENTKYNAVKSDAVNALNAANMYFAEEPTASKVTVEKLVTDGYLENKGKLTDSIEINNVKPAKTIDGTSEAFAGGKTVIFSAATLEGINNDKQKGSSDNSKTITGSGTTSPTPPAE
ncbi:type II secretion system protein [Sporosarcina sp. FSL W7-1349]|uniref:type II secretion system protein n=1 Tax=Sporosarcina sp. FSL W7-1349 TaxID=2921561 RepID=UPI0030F6F5C2